MKTVQEEQIEVLTTLIQYCNDGFSGYFEIASKTENVELKTILNRLSQQRKLFAEELNEEVIILGGKRIAQGSAEGKIHQMWINIKALFTVNKIRELLEEAIKGEKFIQERYAKSLSSNIIPSFIREKLIVQHALIKGAIVQLGEFKKTLNPK